MLVHIECGVSVSMCFLNGNTASRWKLRLRWSVLLALDLSPKSLKPHDIQISLMSDSDSERIGIVCFNCSHTFTISPSLKVWCSLCFNQMASLYLSCSSISTLPAIQNSCPHMSQFGLASSAWVAVASRWFENPGAANHSNSRHVPARLQDNAIQRVSPHQQRPLKNIKRTPKKH